MDDRVLDTALRQARTAGDLDTAQAEMLGAAIERGENVEAASALLDQLILASNRRLDDVRELLHVQHEHELHQIHDRWFGPSA